MSDKPVVWFKLKDIPVSLPYSVRQDLKTLAQMGDYKEDGKKDKYDRIIDSTDFDVFYATSPAGNNVPKTFRKTIDDFKTAQGINYQALHQYYVEWVKEGGPCSLALFNSRDGSIPYEHRKRFKELAALRGNTKIVEDVDVEALIQGIDDTKIFNRSQLVSLSTFQGVNFDYEGFGHYIAFIEEYAKKDTSPFGEEFIYSGRKINNAGESVTVTTPFTAIPGTDPKVYTYTDATTLSDKFKGMLKSVADSIISRYPVVGQLAPDIIVATNGNTGYYVHKKTDATYSSYPVSGATYLFPFVQDRNYVADLNIGGTSHIKLLDDNGDTRWNINLGLGNANQRRSLFVDPFEVAKENPLYAHNQSIPALEDLTWQLALDRAFETAWKDVRTTSTITGNIDLTEIQLLQERVKQVAKVYLPQTLFDRMAEGIREVSLSRNTPLGVTPVEFSSKTKNPTDKEKHQIVLDALKGVTDQIGAVGIDSDSREAYLWIVGANINRVRVVTEEEINKKANEDKEPSDPERTNPDGLFGHDSNNENRKFIFIKENILNDRKHLQEVLLHESAHAAMNMFNRMDILTYRTYALDLTNDINRRIIPSLPANSPLAQHPYIQNRTKNAQHELLANALALYWTKPEQLEQDCLPLYHLMYNLHHFQPTSKDEVPTPVNPFTLTPEKRADLLAYALNEWKADLKKL